MTGAFGSFHPIVNFVYFISVIVFSMFIMHPLFLSVSVACAFIYSVKVNGKKALKFNLTYLLPAFLLMAVLNPVFNHAGATILFYLDSGNPITLESIVYGIAAAAMFVAVIMWFCCYNAVMTSDKFIYLFGTVMPALSLTLSMALRFVPRFKEQIKVIANAQKCIGRDASNGNVFQRVKHGLRILSIMVTWALENSIETADSMRARGYGLPGRTAFSIFRFDRRDKLVLSNIVVIILLMVAGAYCDALGMRYFPSLKPAQFTWLSALLVLAYAQLCLIPVFIELWEDAKWQSMTSRN